LQERLAARFGLGHEEFDPLGKVTQIGFGDMILQAEAGVDVRAIEVLETFFPRVIPGRD
jgi:hypothetical protein